MSVLIDTSAVIAVYDDLDPNHERALEWLSSSRASQATLVTHGYVEVETLALVQRRYGMDACRTIQHAVLDSVEPIWMTPILHARGLRRFLESGRSLSVVDAMSFEVMLDAGITAAFAFDEDFRRAGFELVAA